MIKETIETSRGPLVRLAAEEGRMLTDADETFFSTEIFLGSGDSPENYREVTEPEAERREAENRPGI